MDEDVSSDRSTRPGVLVLPDHLRVEILIHVRDSAPLESVGLLAAERDFGDGAIRACRYIRGTNQDASATRYTMAPEEVLAALREIDDRGWRLGGIVHSHPVGPATPSPTDRREYRYPEALMIIVSLAGDAPVLRAWWFGDPEHGAPAETPVVDRVRHEPGTRREE